MKNKENMIIRKQKQEEKRTNEIEEKLNRRKYMSRAKGKEINMVPVFEESRFLKHSCMTEKLAQKEMWDREKK